MLSTNFEFAPAIRPFFIESMIDPDLVADALQ